MRNMLVCYYVAFVIDLFIYYTLLQSYRINVVVVVVVVVIVIVLYSL
jgi:hypothetical protein